MLTEISILHAYKDAFGDVPTVVGLDTESYASALKLLQQAVEIGVPFNTDAEFYDALGIEAPPEDVDV